MFSRRLAPSRIITLLWLIGLPFCLLIIIGGTVMNIVWYENIEPLNYYVSLFPDLMRNLLMVTLLIYGAALLVYIPYYADFFVYFPYHADHYREYFNKSGVVEAVKEYQFSRKLFGIAAAITIFLIFLNSYFAGEIIGPQLYSLLSLLIIFSGATVVLAIRFAGQYSRKDFDFYLTRAYCIVSFGEEDDVEKFKYLMLGLDSYNKFLERHLKLKIKDIMRIYSMFIYASAEQKIKLRESIGKALEKQKLELARQLSESFSLQDKEQFLVREPAILNQGFKDVLTIIVPAIISIVAFIITILTQFGILQ
jgi:hypothetical protein